MTIRKKVTIAASAIAMLLVIGMALVNVLTVKYAQDKLMRSVNESQALLLKRIINRQFEQMRDETSAMELNYELRLALRDGDSNNLNQYAGLAASMLKDDPNINMLIAADKAGRIKYSSAGDLDNGIVFTAVKDTLRTEMPASMIERDSRGRPLMVLAFPLKVRRETIGAGAYISTLDKAIGVLAEENDTAAYLLGMDHIIRSGTDMPLNATLMADSRLAGAGLALESFRHSDKAYQASKQPMFDSAGGPIGYLMTLRDDTEAYFSHKRFMSMLTGIVMAVAALVIIGLNLYLRKSLGPIRKNADALVQIANGNLSVKIDSSTDSDEMRMLSGSMTTMAQRLQAIMGRVVTSSDEVAATSAQLEQGAGLMKADMSSHAEGTSKIASASTEVSQSIMEIARDASDISTYSQATLGSARSGLAVVTDTRQATERIATTISDASEKIATLRKVAVDVVEILHIINDIADQTNLLALNAAIEAARAGENGRGFAVVADEVRKLAEKTSKSTTSIDAMLKTMQGQSEQASVAMDESVELASKGVKLSVEAAAVITDIVKNVENLGDSIRRIAASTGQISNASELMSADLEMLDRIARKTSRKSEEIFALSHQLNTLSAQIQGAMSFFSKAGNTAVENRLRTRASEKSNVIIKNEPERELVGAGLPELENL